MKRMCGGCVVVLLLGATAGRAEERLQSFDKDPQWEGINNHGTARSPRTVRQDFGYRATSPFGGGAVGGFLTPAAEPAYYAKRIDRATFATPLSASGKLVAEGRRFHVLVGFFNAATVNEWRTPNAIVLRLQGRGDVCYAFVEYATGRWRAGGDSPGGFATVRDPKTGRAAPRGFPLGKVLDWSLRYDPAGNNGGGSVTVALGGETAICHLSPGHKADGATFDRFGLLPVSKSADDGGALWLSDLTVGGKTEDLTRDPGWEGLNNRRTYESANVRPRFDFGYSPTRFAGGRATGELGGLTFRGDCRSRERLAAYGDRLAPLSLDGPLRASGRVSLRRGVTDSTTLLGFYHSEDSLRVNPAQDSGWPMSFLGVAVEGPSREGFFFYPAYRVRGGQGHAAGDDRPRILPDGAAHDWSLAYDPTGNRGSGRVTVTLGKASATVDLAAGVRAAGGRFNRFGLVTTWIDGNGQNVYFDDLRYTCSP